MDYNKLKENQMFKNYKEFCKFIGWKYHKGGDSKKAQFKELSKFCDYKINPNHSIKIIKTKPLLEVKNISNEELAKIKNDINNCTEFGYEKLLNGMQFNSYKDLCEFIGWKYNLSNKDTKLKELEEFCYFECINNTYFIKDVYTTRRFIMRDDEKNNKKIMKNAISNCILCLISKEILENKTIANDTDQVFVGKSKLMESVGLANINFNTCKAKILETSKYLNVDYKTTQEFFNLNNKNFLNILESGIKQLRNYRIIDWTYATNICFSNLDNENIEYGYEEVYDEVEKCYKTIMKAKTNINTTYRLATDEEVEFILNIENIALRELGLKNIQEVFVKNYINKFYNLVRTKLANSKELRGYNFSYKGYKIYYTINGVIDYFNTYLNMDLTKLSYDEATVNIDKLLTENRYIVNVYNQLNIDKLTESRKYKAISTMKNDDIKTIRSTVRHRANENYIENTNNLKDNTVDLNSNDFRDEIIGKEIKTNEVEFIKNV